MTMKSSHGYVLLLFVSASLSGIITPPQAATCSLARDFSYENNRSNSTWTYRL